MNRPSLAALERELAERPAHGVQVTVEDVGRLSAEAVQAQYDAAAKAVENMGVEVKERIQKLEAMLLECDKDMKLLAECANVIREKGNMVRAQIDEASTLSQDIRKAATEFTSKVK